MIPREGALKMGYLLYKQFYNFTYIFRIQKRYLKTRHSKDFEVHSPVSNVYFKGTDQNDTN